MVLLFRIASDPVSAFPGRTQPLVLPLQARPPGPPSFSAFGFPVSYDSMLAFFYCRNRGVFPCPGSGYIENGTTLFFSPGQGPLCRLVSLPLSCGLGLPSHVFESSTVFWTLYFVLVRNKVRSFGMVSDLATPIALLAFFVGLFFLLDQAVRHVGLRVPPKRDGTPLSMALLFPSEGVRCSFLPFFWHSLLPFSVV